MVQAALFRYKVKTNWFRYEDRTDRNSESTLRIIMRLISEVLLLIVAVLVSVLYVVYSYPGYKDRVPNGGIISHPCFPGTVWGGLGHELVGGRGVRNPFGRDFEANGNVWNVTVCEMDSDLDGKTNGEELGDPDCVFHKGAIPQRNTSLSHPGVCEPPLTEFCLRANGLWMNITGCKSGASPVVPGMKHTVRLFTSASVVWYFAIYRVGKL